MTDTDRTLLKKQEGAALNGLNPSTDALAAGGAVYDAHTFTLTFEKNADDALAATATAEIGTGIYLPVKAELVGCWAILLGATTLTGHATNYATILIDKNDSAGANNANVISFASDTPTTDNLAVKVPKDLMGYKASAAVLACDAGTSFTYQITKAASGVIVPALRIVMRFVAV